jgi:hypothetical protein
VGTVKVVVPAGAVLVGVVLVGVVLADVVVVPVGVVPGAVVVGIEVKVGPTDAGMPTLPALLRCCFGAGWVAGCRLRGADLRPGATARAGCGARLA